MGMKRATPSGRKGQDGTLTATMSLRRNLFIGSIRRSCVDECSEGIAKLLRNFRCCQCQKVLADLENMKVCLRLTIDQHPKLSDRLLATGDAEIVEDSSKRDLALNPQFTQIID